MTKCRACHGTKIIHLKRNTHAIHLCTHCFSISLDTKNDPNTEYDQEYYLKYYKSRESKNYKECQDLIRDCKHSINEQILDYGAGSGVLGSVLIDKGFNNVFMYDISVHAQEYMKKRFKSYKILKTTKNLKYKFKTVFMTDVLSHLKDVDGVIVHLTRELTSKYNDQLGNRKFQNILQSNERFS
ncbi:class I SAM-dependent methyltransferase [Alphaproteobacteria bacterium]|nr:class I SAM-dependent methyltransferase [Alphaproteobacteria bacterium]